MASINDWAAKCAREISVEIPHYLLSLDAEARRDERLAAIIALHAEPLVKLLLESKREHVHDERCNNCCSRCTHESWPLDTEDVDESWKPSPNSDAPCTCGADAWNARVDAALNGGSNATLSS